ncbi:uncharacterized protein EV420DRAFT_1585435 [Desarmillaria tabescens]|uniref:Secreted protein n=1 Tax=Armillaria tabescens TaxID=1929756 RepID=A0AA39JDR4_ARMTA|nr:uncharacterized protein EV420DRAFT_1585435 [Desarmillaria tabescens]KAK0438733.1 hypothetical protein EV420DRAFT_1585435 [Desarmillaria tabescens]
MSNRPTRMTITMMTSGLCRLSLLCVALTAPRLRGMLGCEMLPRRMLDDVHAPGCSPLRHALSSPSSFTVAGNARLRSLIVIESVLTSVMDTY